MNEEKESPHDENLGFKNDLPQPLKPTTAVVCPARATRERFLRTETSFRDG